MTPLRLTRRQSREVDRIAIEEYGIAGIVLMENAARSVVDAIADLLHDLNGDIAVVCGPGDNGGDGLAIARHLRNRGHGVIIVLAAPPERFRGDAATQLLIISHTEIPCVYVDPSESSAGVDSVRAAALVIDAMFGTGLSRPPADDVAGLIDACDGSRRPVIAVDLPSGMDCNTGLPLGRHCVRATRTVTMATHKSGFANPAAREWTGAVIVGDIGVPREIIDRAAASPA